MDLLIKGDLHKPVSVVNGYIEQGKDASKPPLEGLSHKAKAGDSFVLVHTTLISSNKVVDNSNTSILDRQGVKVYKDEDILILVKGKPVMVGKYDRNGCFKKPIVQRYNMQLELLLPGCHCRNTAEVTIHNFRCHFLSILAGLANDFLFYPWERVFPQAEITLTMFGNQMRH